MMKKNIFINARVKPSRKMSTAFIKKGLMKIKKPDYKAVTFQAHRTFRLFTNHIYPVNLLSIIDEMHNTELATYEEFANEINATVDFVAQKIGKNSDAFTLNRGGEFIIVYNSDTTTNIPERIRFTLAHEIGHILLGHFLEDDLILTRGGLTEDRYRLLEKEADTFARELLAPSFMMNLSWSIEKIHRIFDVSKSVAGISLNFKKKHPWIKPTFALSDLYYRNRIYRRPREDITTLPCRDYREFIKESTKFAAILHPVTRYFCNSCKNIEKTYISEIKYCPICNNSNLTKIPYDNYYIFYETKEREYMSYNKLKIDNEGRLAENCPICNNKHVRDNYCSVCGVDIINRCSGNRMIVDDNGYEYYQPETPCEGTLLGGDRYCPKCGCESTFFNNDLLQAWNAPRLSTIQKDPFESNIVYDIKDEDLPF